ncbi:MAG: ABC transporter permease [Chloroflexia bacterium]|jgi:peptide/nickel transport system permease protein|nr:ABC transporter permease [Chloroflexia bacterium]
MGAYVLRRVLWAIPLLLFVSVVVYGLLELSPGGPTSMYMRRGTGMSAADLAAVEESLGLNDPVYQQYGRWLWNVVQGDFGMATTSSRPVSDEILDRLPNTLYLMGIAWAVSLLIAIPIGVYSAIRQYSKFDHVVTALTFVGQSIPSFFLGLILLFIFYMRLDNPFSGGPLLPSGGVQTIGADLTGFALIKDRVAHLILPVTMLAATWVAWYSRFLRASMLETIHLDYVRTGRAKGLRERTVIVRHAFRNAAVPLVTLMALDLPLLFSGALFAEVIFSWPGMGRLFFQAAERRDFGILMAVVMITSFLIIVGNLLADIAYRLLDPRIKLR